MANTDVLEEEEVVLWKQKSGEPPYMEWPTGVPLVRWIKEPWYGTAGEIPYRFWTENVPKPEFSKTRWVGTTGEIPYRFWTENVPKDLMQNHLWMQEPDDEAFQPWVNSDPLKHYPHWLWMQKMGYEAYRPWSILPEEEIIFEVDPELVVPDINWTDTMQQLYEHYLVDPGTWHDVRRLDEVISADLTHDLTSDTMGNASIETTELLDENYIRTYLVARQGGYEYKTCLGTFLYMSSGDEFDGVIHTYSMTGYSPLIELKETLPPPGWFVPSGTNIPETVAKIVTDNCRAEKSLENALGRGGRIGTSLIQNYVANINDDWLSVITGLLQSGASDKYALTLDARGVVSMEKVMEPEAMSPMWTYDDGNSSILMPNVSLGVDLYGIPNVVEVIYSGASPLMARVVNDDPESIVSTVNRKREIVRRITDVNMPGTPTQEAIEEYARLLLESLSTINNKITYSHAYCPVRVGDCVLLNYTRAGLNNVKARVISQNIKCTPGCIVSETALYTTKLWRAY